MLRVFNEGDCRMKVTKVSKTILVSMLAAVFLPVMIAGVICAAIKIAYRFGYGIAQELMERI